MGPHLPSDHQWQFELGYGFANTGRPMEIRPLPGAGDVTRLDLGEVGLARESSTRRL
jgi:hypothetical protein